MLSAEAGEHGRDAGDELRESGPSLKFGVPTLDHHIVAERKRETEVLHLISVLSNL